MKWIESRSFDLLWIIGPAFLSVLFVLLFHTLGLAPQTTSPLYWLIFVVFIDVAHVWSTIFRTYLNRKAWHKDQKLFWLVPIACYALGVILHSMGMMLFWRVLAYLAVFHFIRQQYGIFKIYADKSEPQGSQILWLDKLAIYAATIIPMLIWHMDGPREMNWFMAGDFYYLPFKGVTPSLITLGAIILIGYLVKEFKGKKSIFTSPKSLFLLGTMLSWWVGIVLLKTDWSFTITNVVSHGIPYFALIYLSNMKKREELLWPKVLPTFTIFLLLLGLGYFEEALWDAFIWRDHTHLFSFFARLPVVESLEGMSLLVPLLTLPQATHYVLDGFIWRREDAGPIVNNKS